jgi:Zn-finger nucleic acid-binding protein
MANITCPKCQAEMRSYERNGVTIEQCTDCRGVFLDRGELDRMIDAENQRYEQPTPPPMPAMPQQPQYREEYRDDHRDRDRYYDNNKYGYKKKKKHGFLSELFDD